MGGETSSFPVLLPHRDLPILSDRIQRTEDLGIAYNIYAVIHPRYMVSITDSSLVDSALAYAKPKCSILFRGENHQIRQLAVLWFDNLCHDLFICITLRNITHLWSFPTFNLVRRDSVRINSNVNLCSVHLAQLTLPHVGVFSECVLFPIPKPCAICHCKIYIAFPLNFHVI